MRNNQLKIIVSIDGGGIRGILPLLILRYIDQLAKEKGLTDNFSKSIDLIAGTSTGALISAGLVVKENGQNMYSIDELLGLYSLRGPQLFNLTKPNGANSKGLRLLLKRKFKGFRLSDLGIHYAFVSYDITHQVPFVFENDNETFKDFPISTALAACSAVPGLFPSVNIEDKYELVDGAMTAKDPADIAYECAQKYFPNADYLLLSFGTGQLEGDMYDEIEKEVDRVNKRLREKETQDERLKYYRFQPEIRTADPKMDNATPENIQALIDDGNSYIKDNKNLFDSLFSYWGNLS